ncbi:MAG: hypothetical protein P8X57_09820, partial [Cyclobacteriaceae bacterium]
YNEQLIGAEEFLSFCGVLGLGRIGKIDPINEPVVVADIKNAAQDERWRIREAAAMAIQDLIDARPKATLVILRSWVHEENYLLNRAVVAGIAEPRFMKEREHARIALELHKTILKQVSLDPSMHDPHLKVLVKGLSYTLSVVITGTEKEGFAFLEALLATEHPLVRKIVRENLKKKRLVRLNPDKVALLQQKLMTSY